MLPSMWELGGTAAAPPAAQLVRALWHRHEPQQPLHPTRNRSLAGYHLAEDASLLGHCFGLAVSGTSHAGVVSALQGHRYSRLARRSKVSLSRFAKIALLASPNAVVPSASAALPAGCCGTTVLVSFLWCTARTKACFLKFFSAAALHLPAGSLLASDASLALSSGHRPWISEWLQDAFDDSAAADGSSMAVTAAATLVHASQATGRPHYVVAESEGTARAGATSASQETAVALEVLAFALASRGSMRPEIEQSRHSFHGQEEVPDCVEALARDTISLALWDSERATHDVEGRLPPSADERLRHFFSTARGGYSSGRESGAEWFAICSARPGLHYLSGGSQRTSHYELAPSPENLVAALQSLLGLPLSPPTHSHFVPMWPGAHVAWQLTGPFDRPVIRIQPLLSTSTAGCVDSEDLPRTVSPRAHSEDLRLIFNGAGGKQMVHCYALRQVVHDSEPQWLKGLRRVWLQRWRVLADGNGAASTDVGLHVRKDGAYGGASARASVVGDGCHSAAGGGAGSGGANAEESVPEPLIGVLAAASSCLLRHQLLLARAHHFAKPSAGTPATVPDEPSSAAAAVLAVLAAAPVSFEERLKGLRLCCHAGPRTHWTLPLLLQPPHTTGYWDDLTLGACVDLLHSATSDVRRQVLPLCIDAATRQPVLQAALALRAEQETLMHALGRCSEDERRQIMRIATGHTGYTARQRMGAWRALGWLWLSKWKAATSVAVTTDPLQQSPPLGRATMPSRPRTWPRARCTEA